MKLLLSVFILFTLLGYAKDMSLDREQKGNHISFAELWGEVVSDPLDRLPQESVSFFKLYSSGKNTLLKDSQRTLDEHSDILEPFEKLAHPNGICLKGVWEIDSKNIFSGYFKQSSQALIIARASTAMSNTKSGDIRSFGFAGKLFPTMSADLKSEERANFFLIDDLGGTDALYYRDVELTNEPSASINFEVVKNMLYALEVSRVFNIADENPGIRQLYEISQLGESESKNIITPKWMKIEAQEAPKKVDAKDFRDELNIKDGESLIFNIFVANKMINKERDWQKIGRITFDESIVSSSCDNRLHFHHPKWRSDLDYGVKSR